MMTLCPPKAYFALHMLDVSEVTVRSTCQPQLLGIWYPVFTGYQPVGISYFSRCQSCGWIWWSASSYRCSRLIVFDYHKCLVWKWGRTNWFVQRSNCFHKQMFWYRSTTDGYRWNHPYDRPRVLLYGWVPLQANVLTWRQHILTLSILYLCGESIIIDSAINPIQTIKSMFVN